MSESKNGKHEETPEQKRAFVEWFLKQQADYFWCLNQLDILERYPGQIVVLHDRKVIGSGAGTVEAREDAKRQVEARGETLPPSNDLLCVVIPERIWFDETIFPRPAQGFPAAVGLTEEGSP
jgi:hypothetical protein